MTLSANTYGLKVIKTVVGFDFESHLSVPGNITPRVVCLSRHVEGIDDDHGHTDLTTDYATMKRWWLEALDDPTALIVIQNAAFDVLEAAVHLGVPLSRLLLALEEGKIVDTMVREQLAGIAFGWSQERVMAVDPRTRQPFSVSLAAIVNAHFNVDISGDKKSPDAWRMRYSELDGVPLEEWPEEAVSYAEMDSVWAVRAWKDQCRSFDETDVGSLYANDAYLWNEIEQVCASVALNICAINGPRAEKEAVEKFIAYHEEKKRHVEEEIGLPLGFLCWNKNRHKVSQDPKTRRWTYEGGYSTNKEVLKVLVADVHNRRVPLEHVTDSGQEYLATLGADYLDLPVGEENTKVTWIGKDKQGNEKERSAKLHAFVSDSKDALMACGCSKYVHPDVREEWADSNGREWEQECQCNGCRLAYFGEESSSRKMIDQYAGILLSAVDHPLTSSPWFLVNTGRTSWREPNMQNPPRSGGFRECFVARPGKCFVSVDYNAIELSTLAQEHIDIYGHSTLADLINAGKDPHSWFGSQLIGVTYEEFLAGLKSENKDYFKDVRQAAKAAMFGLGGGMGANRMVQTYGTEVLCRVAHPHEVVHGDDTATAPIVAARLKKEWLASFPEEKQRQQGVGRKTANDRLFAYRHAFSNRVRGKLSYCDGCNTPFQGRAADGAKAALWEITKRIFTGDPLLKGVRIWLFVHDELLFEGPQETVEAWAPYVTRLMIEAMKRYVPDVAVGAEPAVCRRWYKGADAIKVDGKQVFIPWEPWKKVDHKDEKTPEEHRQYDYVLEHVTKGLIGVKGDLTVDKRLAAERAAGLSWAA